jgi:hypothetical protein
MAFVEVVGGTAIYNFPICHLVHFYYKILRKTMLNSATLKHFAPERTQTMRARDVAHGRVSPPPYSPYTNAEAGQ